MLIKMIKDDFGVKEWDIYPNKFTKGKVYNLNESLANGFLQRDSAIEAEDKTEKIEKKQIVEPAKENKMIKTPTKENKTNKKGNKNDK